MVRVCKRWRLMHGILFKLVLEVGFGNLDWRLLQILCRFGSFGQIYVI